MSVKNHLCDFKNTYDKGNLNFTNVDYSMFLTQVRYMTVEKGM